MLINFFYGLKNAGSPVSIKELLTLLEALGHNLAFADIHEFYFLSRADVDQGRKILSIVSTARSARIYIDLESLGDILEALIPDEWLRADFMKQLSDEDKAKVKSLGSLEKLIEEFKKRLDEQKDRHQGGNKWIGTGGTSPFGHSGYNPEGIRVGGESKNKSAVKVWDRRDFKNLDDSVELGTRNVKIALRRLRKFARSGAAEELDLPDTIRSTAKNAGYLDLKMVPERHNAVKVLLFFDIGGSMDPYVKQVRRIIFGNAHRVQAYGIFLFP